MGPPRLERSLVPVNSLGRGEGGRRQGRKKKRRKKRILRLKETGLSDAVSLASYGFAIFL
jgi:hypothetical protein